MHTRFFVVSTLLTFALAGCGQSDPLAYSNAQLEYQARLVESERAEARATALEPFERAVGASWRLALAALPLVALGIGVDAYRRRATPLIRPDERGQLPVVRAQIETGQLTEAFTAALAAFHTQQLAAAQRPVIDKLSITVKEPSIPQLPAVARSLECAESEAPALPSIVELADVLPTVRGGHLAFGMLPNGELLQLPFGKAYHFLCAGDTRSGKTVQLDSLIVQLHHMAQRLPISLYGGDFKRELAATWHASPLFSTIETQPGAIADMLVDLVEGPDGIHRRYDTFKHEGQQRGRIIRNVGDWRTITGELPKLSIVVLDEINAVLEAAKRSDRVAESLKVLLQTGAGAGVYVLGGAQYLSSAVFSRDGSKQFVSRCLFGAYDDTAARMMFGSVDSAIRSQIDGTPGRGLIRTVSQSQPQPFQALHAGEQDILDAIASIHAPVSAGRTLQAVAVNAVPAHSEATNHKQAREVGTFIQPTQSTAQADELPERERIEILALARAGVPRGKIADQVHGGRGKYAAIKALLDAARL
ncbi:MAG: hypothetical protein CYG59_23730 [Chloroflexi bacterium]|nr:MAG: hypothetical protein CYG59_23730 [Chloroflexota bacterium]